MMFYSIENFYNCDDIPKEFYYKKVPVSHDIKKNRKTDLTFQEQVDLDKVDKLSNDDFLAFILMLLMC